MVLVYAVLLGVIQGLTEFLPVSSSAHLVIAKAFFGSDPLLSSKAFDVACHVGTLAAAAVYFWPDILAMLRAVPRLGTIFGPKPDRAAWMAALIILGTVPAVLVGLLFGGVIEDLDKPEFESAMLATVVSTLALVAIVFFVVERWGSRRRTGESLGIVDSVVIGCAQAAALIPGVSRSGATISAGMALGLRRDEAARFSFLLGTLAVLGAATKEGWHFVRHGFAPGESQVFLVGIVSSAVVGYLAIRFCIRYLTRHSLSVFAWYRLALAASVVIWWSTR